MMIRPCVFCIVQSVYNMRLVGNLCHYLVELDWMLDSYKGDVIAIYLHQTKKPTHNVPVRLCKDGKNREWIFTVHKLKRYVEKFGKSSALQWEIFGVFFDCETDLVHL